MFLFRTRLRVALFASVTAAVLTSGIAWAVTSSPIDGSGVIHACFNPTSGALHLNVKGTCPTKGQTTPITWNAQGVAGLQGPPGVQGADGRGLGAVYLAATFTLTSNGCPAGAVHLVEMRQLVGPALPLDPDAVLAPEYQGQECQTISYIVGQGGRYGLTRYLSSPATESLPPLSDTASNPTPLFNTKAETGQPYLFGCTTGLSNRHIFNDGQRRLMIMCTFDSGGLTTAALTAAINAGIESDPLVLRLLPADNPS